jgi:hypothetical protein
LDRKLAVNDKLRERQFLELHNDLGELARERLARFSSKIDVVPGPKSKAAEAIPFRLELPASVIRQMIDEPSLHWL